MNSSVLTFSASFNIYIPYILSEIPTFIIQNVL